MKARSLLAAACVATLVLVALVERAGATPPPLVDPLFNWKFEQYLSDGIGSVQQPPVDAEPAGEQFGGALSESAYLGFATRPNMEVFSNADGTTFWSYARSPGGSPDLRDTPLGARTTFTVTQTFQVVDVAPTLSFTISQVSLDALDPPGGPGNDGLSAFISFQVSAIDQSGRTFFSFLDETSLTGEGLNWNLDDLSGPLVVQIVAGGESQPNLSARLQAPYTGAIDVASFDLRDIFTVRYTIVTEAIDTEQFDSRISAYARDPLDPGSGSSFAYTGLVPIATVPEPTTALLMLLGLGGLAAFAPSRRRGTPGA